MHTWLALPAITTLKPARRCEPSLRTSHGQTRGNEPAVGHHRSSRACAKAREVVNISSQASTKYISFIAGYASTKFVLNNLSLTAREELAKDGITVSIKKPGIVDTDFGKNTPSSTSSKGRRQEPRQSRAGAASAPPHPAARVQDRI